MQTLSSATIKGAAWTLAGHGGAQAIRLLRSLLLTRLLYPEAFGLMSLVMLVMYGLEMLSDVGLGPAIIRDRRGADPEFRNTVWTLQIIRGALLWLGACAIAWPMASFYGAPDLAVLVAVTGVTALIAGFNSTSIHICRRDLRLERLTALEVLVELVGTLVVVAWAWHSPSVWALVVGALATRIFFTVMSHGFLPRFDHRLCWDSQAVRSILGFGKWIYFSSAVEFVSRQGDRLVLGRLLDLASLGVYSVAVLLADAVQAVIIKVNFGVLYPAFGKVVRESPTGLRGAYYRARLGVDALLIVPACTLTMIAEPLVALLYDERYREAGWMLKVLAIRLAMGAALRASEVCLVALGHSRYGFAQSVSRGAWMVATVPIGWALAGVEGVVWAVALSEIPVLVVLWAGLRKHQILSVALELRSLGAAALGVGLGFCLVSAGKWITT